MMTRACLVTSSVGVNRKPASSGFLLELQQGSPGSCASTALV